MKINVKWMWKRTCGAMAKEKKPACHSCCKNLVACVQTNLINYCNLGGGRLARQKLKCRCRESLLHRFLVRRRPVLLKQGCECVIEWLLGTCTVSPLSKWLPLAPSSSRDIRETPARAPLSKHSHMHEPLLLSEGIYNIAIQVPRSGLSLS